jgi:hypothetical protein
MALCRRGSRSNWVKQRPNLRASGLSAAAKKSCASGDRMTSNIGADFPPVHTAARLDSLFRRLESLGKRGPIQKLGVVGKGRQAVSRQMVDDLFDFPSQLGRRHRTPPQIEK